MLTTIVLVKNEEVNLPRCLKSVESISDEIIVIDDQSEDRSKEIAKKYKAKVYLRNLDNDFSSQRNFGLEKAEGDWILFIDADEELTRDLSSEIEQAVKGKEFSAYYLPRQDIFNHQKLKGGEFGRIKIVRLAKKEVGQWERKVDEIWQIKPEIKIGELKGKLLHYSHQDLTQFLTSINERSTLNARYLYEQGVKESSLALFKPLGKFFQNFFFKQGYLDGTTGFVLAVLMSLHSFLVRGKLYLLWEKEKKASENH